MNKNSMDFRDSSENKSNYDDLDQNVPVEIQGLKNSNEYPMNNQDDNQNKKLNISEYMLNLKE